MYINLTNKTMNIFFDGLFNFAYHDLLLGLQDVHAHPVHHGVGEFAQIFETKIYVVVIQWNANLINNYFGVLIIAIRYGYGRITSWTRKKRNGS